MSRFNAILLALVVCTLPVPRALSADPRPGTTPPSAPAPAQPPAPAPDEVDPATGLARSTVVRPLREPGAAANLPKAPDIVPGGPLGIDGKPSTAIDKPHVALILPLASSALGRLADAVRQGFAAAAEAEGRNAPPLILLGVDNEGQGVVEACEKARAAGATLIVAGLTRDGATRVARSVCTRLPVLTLNQPIADAPAEPNPQLYSISLSVEQEARQAALLAVSEGWHSAMIIGSNSALSKRVQDAFEREWVRAAGEVAGRITFTGEPEDAPLVKERLARFARGDMVFLALDQPEARLVRPYVSGMLPVYATSLSVDPRAEATVNVDLQGVRYLDMPWFVQPDHPAVMVYPQPRAALPVEYERLYALGIDALRIASVLLQGEKSRLALDGVTGRITLEGHQFARALTPAEIDGGRVIPLKNP